MAGMTGNLRLAVQRVNDLIRLLESEDGSVAFRVTSWKVGLKLITGQSRSARAEKSFKEAFKPLPEFIEATHYTPAGAAVRTRRSLAEIQASGFLEDELELLKSSFVTRAEPKKKSEKNSLPTPNAKKPGREAKKTRRIAKNWGRAARKRDRAAKNAG
jgi:hypothetical protein